MTTRDWADVVRQREAILELEAHVKTMLRLRQQVRAAVLMLNQGNPGEARRLLVQVLSRWPST